MKPLKLTNASVQAAEASDQDTFLWDRDLHGFGLKVTKAGTKIYIVQYRMGGRGSSTRRYTIGRHESPWTPATARREAERVLMQARTGADPQLARSEKRRDDTALAFSVYAERFLELYGRPAWKPKTYFSAASNMRRWVIPPLQKSSLLEIRRRDVTAVLDRVPSESPALARSVFALMRKLFAWAVSRGDIEKSPCDGMTSPPAVASRERVLDSNELRAILAASTDNPPPFGPFLRLLLLTGQRRDEVAGMRWEELDQMSEEWRLPAARTKNSRVHTVPLGTSSIAELSMLAGTEIWPETGFVLTTNGRSPISGFSRMKRRLDQQVVKYGRVAAWRLHDLRRSMATGFQRLGVRFEVTEAVLNHVSGAQSGVAGVYQRHNWNDEKRTAMQLWADHLYEILSPQIV